MGGDDDDKPADPPKTETVAAALVRRWKQQISDVIEALSTQVPIVDQPRDPAPPPLALPSPAQIAEPEPAPAPKGKVGRPREHNWDSALQYFQDYYADKELPPIKERVIEQVEEWFRTNDGPKVPNERDIRERIIKKLYRGN